MIWSGAILPFNNRVETLIPRDQMVPAADPEASVLRHVAPPGLEAPAGYSQVVETRASRLIFIAGQTAVDGEGRLVGKNDFDAQVDQVFRNLDLALRAVGCNASHLAKMTVFLTDMGHLATYRAARTRFFETVAPAAAPAVTLVEVSRLYGADFLIEVEAIAAI
jgi:enamine deaminase RidA (YjgF/YER057c/UK114 family)